jgi:hypothetical protein
MERANLIIEEDEWGNPLSPSGILLPFSLYNGDTPACFLWKDLIIGLFERKEIN